MVNKTNLANHGWFIFIYKSLLGYLMSIGTPSEDRTHYLVLMAIQINITNHVLVNFYISTLFGNAVAFIRHPVKIKMSTSIVNVIHFVNHYPTSR